jgi:hypothetical protein
LHGFRTFRAVPRIALGYASVVICQKLLQFFKKYVHVADF